MSSTGKEIARRLSQRIAELGLTDNSASTKAGVDRGYIGQLRRLAPSRSPTVKSLASLSRSLGLRLSWVVEGCGPRLLADRDGDRDTTGMIVVERELLTQAITFALMNEGVGKERAELIADIVPEALSGPPVDAVEGNPFLSFRVHYQLEARKFGHLEPG